jgi:hypothetical protein
MELLDDENGADVAASTKVRDYLAHGRRGFDGRETHVLA